MIVLACISMAAWLYLLVFHGRYWHCDQILQPQSSDLGDREWPTIGIVIPARDESETIERVVMSVLQQDYPGLIKVYVVDDNSTDGTGDIVRGISDERVTPLSGQPLPEGWSGKMWAVFQGVQSLGDEEYILLTDADIEHAPVNLRLLVEKIVRDDLGLVSLMVRLRCESGWEKFLIPPFIYFFQQLYPFPWVNNTDTKCAAAAGGCMLVKRNVLSEAGGIYEIRDEIIDDCALARLIKRRKPIWLGLGETAMSLRAYEDLGPIWRMVARTAYVQLNHNPVYLIGTVLGMGFLYIFPPVGVLVGGLQQNLVLLGLSTLTVTTMVWSLLPTLDIYRRSPVWAFTMPAAAVMYALMTLDSARRHYLGRGSAWKNRTYDARGDGA